MIATRPAGVFEKGLFRQDVLDRDVAALQAFVRAQGFADATVGPAEVRFEDDRTRAHRDPGRGGTPGEVRTSA